MKQYKNVISCVKLLKRNVVSELVKLTQLFYFFLLLKLSSLVFA